MIRIFLNFFFGTEIRVVGAILVIFSWVFGIASESWLAFILPTIFGVVLFSTHFELSINTKQKWFKKSFILLGIPFGKKEAFDAIQHIEILKGADLELNMLGPMGSASEKIIYFGYLKFTGLKRIKIGADQDRKRLLRKINDFRFKFNNEPPIRSGNINKGQQISLFRKGYIYVINFVVFTVAIHLIFYNYDLPGGLSFLLIFPIANSSIYLLKGLLSLYRKKVVKGMIDFLVAILFLTIAIKIYWSYYNILLVSLITAYALFVSFKSKLNPFRKSILRGLSFVNVMLILIPGTYLFRYYQKNTERTLWRDLEWSDFQKIRNDTSYFDASIHSNLLDRVNKAYNYPPALILGYMLPHSSTKKDMELSYGLLKHEQGHFDLTEIFRRKAVDSVKKSWGKSPDDISRIIQHFRVELSKRQQFYDSVTNHNLNQAEQVSWNSYLDLMLRQRKDVLSPLNNAEKIGLMESTIDSLMRKNLEIDASLTDSLLKLDEKNYRALFQKGVDSFNDGNHAESVSYLGKAFKQDSSDAFLNILLGWAYEREGDVAKSKELYQSGLELIDVEWGSYYMIPQLVTVLHGEEEGINSAISLKDSMSVKAYYEVLNDIENYGGDGMSEFFPLFFGYSDTIEFYVKIPDDLFNSGQINSMRRVETAFAKMGINVWVKSTDSANNGYVLTTSTKYYDKLSNIDTLGIRRYRRNQ